MMMAMPFANAKVRRFENKPIHTHADFKRIGKDSSGFGLCN